MSVFPQRSTPIIGNTLEARQMALPALCVSDIHIRDADDPVVDQLIELVERIQPKSLLFIGDIFDGWIGWDIDPKLYDRWHTWTTQLHIPLFFIPGNRDRLITQKALGVHITLLDDPCIFMIHGERWLMTHGDMYCTHDTLHQFFIRLHTPWLKKIFLSLPKSWRMIIKKIMIKQSYNHKKRVNLSSQRIDTHTLQSLHKKYGAYMIVYGHIHMPQYVQSDGVNAITLGDWGKSPSYLHIPADSDWVLHFTQ